VQKWLKNHKLSSRALIFTATLSTLAIIWPGTIWPNCSFITMIPGIPQRAARLSAAVKRYKTYRMLNFIFEIADSIDLDLTPLTVNAFAPAFLAARAVRT
jgi:hypothetical protein